MLNLAGLSFAQKLHVLKYGSLADDGTPPTGSPRPVSDKIDAFMYQFEELQQTMDAKDAFAIASRETGHTYKDYRSFVCARVQWYRLRDRGARPPLNNTPQPTRTVTAFIEMFEPLARKIGGLDAYRQCVAETGKSWASYHTFVSSRFRYYRVRGTYPPPMSDRAAQA